MRDSFGVRWPGTALLQRVRQIDEHYALTKRCQATALQRVTALQGGVLNLDSLNGISEDQLRTELLKCCGSPEWVQRMVQERPFDSVEELSRIAAEIWWDCDPHDWLEAFRSHPKIGGRKAEAEVSGQSHAWSSQEQSSIQKATEATLNDLEQLNREYEKKFGFIFIVCASGKSADEMLAMLRSRLGNDNEKELRIAAGEQAKITELRLKKLLE